MTGFVSSKYGTLGNPMAFPWASPGQPHVPNCPKAKGAHQYLGPATALELLPRLSWFVTLASGSSGSCSGYLGIGIRRAPIACSSAGRCDSEGRQRYPPPPFPRARRGCGGSHRQNFKLLRYQGRSATVSEIRFSDCRDPLDLSITSLVQVPPWLWRQVDRGLSLP